MTIRPEYEDVMSEESVRPTPRRTPKVRTGIVTNCQKLNVRSAPSLQGKVLRVINAGTKVKIIDKNLNTAVSAPFVCVDLGNGKQGYVMKKYLQENETRG